MVNLGVFLLALCGIELAMGNWLRPDRMRRLNLPRDVELSFAVEGLYPSKTGISVYRRDEFGFRGSYSSPAEIDVLTVGGSTTDQRLLSEGETWQDVLAAEFRRHGRSISVVNGGVDGQSTYGHIKNFEWWYPQVPLLKVGYFLFYLGVNDFYKHEGYDHDRLVRKEGLAALLEANSALYELVSTVRGLRQAYHLARHRRQRLDFAALRWTETGRVGDYDHLMRARLSAYRQRLAILLRRVEEHGAGAICVTQPTRRHRLLENGVEGVDRVLHYDGVPFNGVDHYHMMQRLNRTTLRTCRELGQVGLDLASEVRWEDADFYDFVHNTPRGARKIGLYLHRELQGRL